MWTVSFLSLTTDFEMSEICELLSWYLRGCNSCYFAVDENMGYSNRSRFCIVMVYMVVTFDLSHYCGLAEPLANFNFVRVM